MPKVTESLRRTWADQRAQSLEDREFTQSGVARSESDIAIVDFDVEVHDRLLNLPVGMKFDAREIESEMRKEKGWA